MKLIKNSVSKYLQAPGISGVFKSIRESAAICYQTDVEKSKLTSEEFCENVLLKNAHLRPLEFGTVYLKVPQLVDLDDDSKVVLASLQRNHWTKWKTEIIDKEPCFIITTNYRVIVIGDYETDKKAYENNYDKNFKWFMEKYWCEPTEFHELRPCFTMIMSRGCSDDFRTHISLSSICESTRYCNYSNGKFGSELTFIQPYWLSDEDCAENVGFIKSMRKQESDYLYWAGMGDHQPQQLKRLYPLGGKVELRLCGFNEDWDNFFWRRCDSHADPECQIVADMIKQQF